MYLHNTYLQYLLGTVLLYHIFSHATRFVMLYINEASPTAVQPHQTTDIQASDIIIPDTNMKSQCTC